MVKKPFGSGSGSGGAGAGGVVGGMIRSMVLLPLNFVPVVGTLLYVYVKGKKAGPGLHARYFQLRGLGGRDREEWVEKRRGGYTGYVFFLPFFLFLFRWFRLFLVWLVWLTGTGLEWRLCCWRWCPLRRWCLSLVTLLGLRCGQQIWRRQISSMSRLEDQWMGYTKQILDCNYCPLNRLIQIEQARMQYTYIYTLTIISTPFQEDKLNYTPAAGTAADVVSPLTPAGP